MTPLPAWIQASLEELLNAPALRAEDVRGGMIGRAARVHTPEEIVFVKWNESAPPEMLEAEMDGLTALSAAGALRVPRVLGFHRDGPRAFLMLEYIEQKPPHDMDAFARRFGRDLAALHAHTDAHFGYGRDNFIGRLPQRNAPAATWTEFFRDRRLLPQMEIARRLGRLPPGREKLLRAVIENLERLLEGLDPRPALLHGDLWSGNYVSAGETPVVFDPAVYFGEREMEVAYMELFGGFPAGVLAAYQDARPLSAGYAGRRPLHQLYPLLVHLNHFGEPYGIDVDSACHQLLREIK